MTPGNRRVRAPQLPLESARTPPLPQPLTPRSAVLPAAVSRFLSVVRAALGVTLVLGAAVAVAYAARRHVTTSSRFATTSVLVSGNERRSSQMVAAESGVSLGENIFLVDLDAARARLLSDPWIADAALARRLPGTVVIALTERRAAAVVALGETLLADARGEPFKRLEPGDPVDLPLITGLRPESVAEDREGSVRAIRRAIDLAAEYERGPIASHASLQEVHVDVEGTFTLMIGRPAIQVALGRPPFRRKLDEAFRVMTELDRRGSRADAILLDSDIRPERVVVRMR
ncbi:MAG: FtsQ-type POTRA domain-containing protein [Myxococcota bacterium]|nr:FtsQ-type POTRA domain-containing protein [Myxococcota bacterium]